MTSDTQAPERIWAIPQDENWSCGFFDQEMDGQEFETEYVRADMAVKVTPQQAAKVLLGDDILLSRMAEAMHDGPLGADDHWFSAATKQGAWCVEMARAALRAIAGGDA